MREGEGAGNGRSVNRPFILSTLGAWRVVDEARRLGMGGPSEDLARAWDEAGKRLGGASRRNAWLARTGIGLAWAQRMVEADLRWRQFVELRFRAFTFVTDADVSAALGPGTHTAEARDRARARLVEEATDRVSR